MMQSWDRFSDGREDSSAIVGRQRMASINVRHSKNQPDLGPLKTYFCTTAVLGSDSGLRRHAGDNQLRPICRMFTPVFLDRKRASAAKRGDVAVVGKSIPLGKQLTGR